jgi:ABC-2 type transport system permease protein
MMVCFLSLGIISASFIMVFKMGDPLGWAFGSVSALFGGMFFPVAVLPGWIRWLAYLLPTTYSLEGMRKSLLVSSSFSDIFPNILALLLFSAVLFPLSLQVFRLSLAKAKKDGTLTHY